MAFYARPGVAAACLELQDREGSDVNLLLLALWLGTVGHRLDTATGQSLAEAGADWQQPFIGPLRQVRRRLKQHLAGADPAWPEALRYWRGRLAEIELALEQMEQLRLELLAGAAGHGAPDEIVARDNFRALGLGPLLDQPEAMVLLATAFPPRPPR